MFQEVLRRSVCQTIEKLVEVVQEYPTEVEHIYSPSCVSLVRCGGCCGDENLECHPTQTTNVTMQVSKALYYWVFKAGVGNDRETNMNKLDLKTMENFYSVL